MKNSIKEYFVNLIKCGAYYTRNVCFVDANFDLSYQIYSVKKDEQSAVNVKRFDSIYTLYLYLTS